MGSVMDCTVHTMKIITVITMLLYVVLTDWYRHRFNHISHDFKNEHVNPKDTTHKLLSNHQLFV